MEAKAELPNQLPGGDVGQEREGGKTHHADQRALSGLVQDEKAHHGCMAEQPPSSHEL